MAPLLALAAAAVLWANAQSQPGSAAVKLTAKQKAAAAFLSRADVSDSVSPDELTADPALAQALPLAAKVQKGGASPDDVRQAAQLLNADQGLALCLYGGGPSPEGRGARQAGVYGQAEPGGAAPGRSRLPDEDRMARLTKSAGGLFDQKQLEAMPESVGAAAGAGAGGQTQRLPAVASAGFKPGVQLPASFKKEAAAPPPLSGKDKVINAALMPVNGERYSRAGTVNRESWEGSKQKICGFLAKANWDPSRAWELSKAARDAKGSDPGDLDARNAEHYLYAYGTTDKPAGWTDSVPVQTVLAVGWTPFKTVTKYFRPTSTPSSDEMSWGVKGALDGWRKPDWKAECGAQPQGQPRVQTARL
jgi:hypothetical protein